jgi:hypothetical protein
VRRPIGNSKKPEVEDLIAAKGFGIIVVLRAVSRCDEERWRL